jgi:hypothetical protein
MTIRRKGDVKRVDQEREVRGGAKRQTVVGNIWQWRYRNRLAV